MAKALFNIVFCCAFWKVIICENHFERPNACNIYYTQTDVIADCSNMGLRDIPPLQRNITILMMAGNKLETLKQDSLSYLTNLHTLDLSSNSISKLQMGSFNGLQNLKKLNLSCNNLPMNNKTFKPRIFIHLRQLKDISIIHNIQHMSSDFDYPSIALSDLVAIETLYIDGIHGKSFTREMSNVQLRQLVMAGGKDGFCSINTLSPGFFEFVPHLETVNLRRCNISSIDPETFTKLQNISILDLSWNTKLTFAGFANVTAGLRNSDIWKLNMVGIYPENYLGTMLKIEHTLHIRNSSLGELNLGHNNLELIEDNVLKDNFPMSLRKLVLDGNRLLSGRYLLELSCLRELKVLRLSDVSHLDLFHPKEYGEEDTAVLNSNMCGHAYFPPLLSQLFMRNAGLRGELGNVSFPGNSIELIDMSNNMLHTWTGPMEGTSQLKSLDLSKNFCHHVDKYFFKGMHRLNVLNLSHNELWWLGATNHSNGTMLNALTGLKHLRITNNHIFYLRPTILKNLRKIQTFDFKENSLSRFDVHLSETPHLSVLDLSYNRLDWISETTRDDMDRIGADLTVHLDYNIFKCDSCNDKKLKLLKWFYETSVNVPNLDKYMCFDGNGKSHPMRQAYHDLTRECAKVSETVIAFSAAGGVALVLLVIAVALVFKYRRRLKYLYYLRRAKFNNGYASLEDSYGSVTPYDALISYADEDRMFVKNDIVDKLEGEAGLKLCIHDRDFPLGCPIEEAITGAISNSKWVIVLLTEYYIRSKWCMLEFNMAREECLYNNRGRLLLMVEYRPMERDGLPPVIQEEMAFNASFCYPQGNDDDRSFWQNLTRTLKSR